MNMLSVKSAVGATALVLMLGCGAKKVPSTAHCVAMVKGTCIDKKMMRPAFRFLSVRQVGGLTEKAAARFVLEGLIDRELLAQEAKKEGVTVSDEELTASTAAGMMYISTSSAPVPAQLGLDAGLVVIDDLVPQEERTKAEEEGLSEEQQLERWIKVLANSTPAEFKDWQAREVLAAKMRARIRAGVKLSEEDAFAQFVEAKTTASVDYVFVQPEWLEQYAVKLDAQEIAAWAAANPAKVAVPVRHIVATGESPEQSEAAKKKVEAALARVKAGEDFAKVVQEVSEDVATKDKGGVYEAEEVEGFVEDFKDAVKVLKPGELSPTVVKTTYGWHVLKRDPATPQANAKSYAKAKAKELATTVTNEIHAAVAGGKTLAAASAAVVAKYGKYGKGAAAAASDPARPRAENATYLRGAEPMSRFSPDNEKLIATFGFESPADKLMPAMIIYDGGVVVQAKGRKVPTKDDFAKERDAFIGHIRNVVGEKDVQARIKSLREAAKDEITIDEEKVWPADAGAARPGRPRDGGPTEAPPPPQPSSQPPSQP